MRTETIDALATAGSRTTGGGAVVGFLGWLASSQAIGLLGICIALLGALVNWYYKREANRRFAAEAEHKRQERELRMELMRNSGRPVFPRQDTDWGGLEADE
ncbi:holin [Pulveribacter sp.]|uniref:holin n=1 Tax=Pulveribacter sp. TaxID=2678893 RepID=UPI00289A2E56|nr:holin [Pulveribacter sp.]